MNRLKSVLATLLTGLLVAAGLTVTAAPAAAAEGDVAGATLDWGIKSSFTSYLQSPIAQGGWTVTGAVSETAPFSWSDGWGSADQGGGTGSVDYGSSIHFTGHDGALDVTFSEFRVVQHDAASASIIVDAVYNSMDAPGEFTTVTGISLATVDLASAADASDATTVGYADAPTTLTADGAAAFGSFYPAGEALDPVSFTWPVEQAPAPPTPTISVSKTEGLLPGGETITVSGTGFLPNAPGTNGTRPPLAGTFSGAYVVFGKFADTWRPSEGAPSSARKVIEQRWAVDPANVDALGAQAVAINADGSFTVTLTVAKTLEADPGNYGIYTFAGSGAVYAPFETYTPISFTTAPVVTVSKTTDIDPAGETLTVSGWNFTPNPPGTNGSRPPLAGTFSGAYVVFGKFADTWRPSEGASSSTRKVIEQRWAVDPANVAALGAQAVALNPDGSFTTTLTVSKTQEADPGNYGIYTFAGSGAVYAPFETATPIAFTPPTATTTTLTASPATGLVAGHSTTLTATVAPAVEGTVTFATGATELATVPVVDGIASHQVTALTEGTHAYRATFVPADPIAVAGSQSEELQLVVTAAPPVPTVTVSKTSELHPGGETITVTGTGFSPQPPATNGSRPPLSGTFGGAYVVFGKFADTWKPSQSAPSSARKVIDQKWVVNPQNVAALGAQAVAIQPDGSFSLTLTVSRTLDADPGNYGIYTFSGSGAVYAPFETYTPVSFSTAPSVLVSKVSDLDPTGDTVTVKGWNFGPNAPATNGSRPPLAGKFGGAYVVFGRFADTWKPSDGAPSSARSVGTQRWVVDPADVATLGEQAVAINADGTFELTLDVAAMPDKAGNYGVYTYPGSGASYAPFETATPISFTAATPTSVTLTANPSSGLVAGDAVTLTTVVAPTAAAGSVRFTEGTSVLGTVPVAAGTASITVSSVVAGSHKVTATFVPANPELWAESFAVLTYDVAAPQVAAGSLTWGVKESFRTYVTGHIAQGSITVNGVGTSGGAFVFGQAAGSSFDPATGLGSSPYAGSVNFYGHHGEMDVTIANPVVRVESPSTATLIVSANGSQVAIATLNLAAGTRTTGGNTVGWSGVPATLTAAGAGVFSLNGSPFYPAGTAMDPVTFVIGSPSARGGTATVAAYQGQREPAPTPPATTGVTVDAASLKNLKAGGEVTITASGFEPFEEDILIVIYSDPVLLDRVSADGDGVVTWTGRLPAGLTGQHTLTVQGSVARGVVLDIPANIRAAAQACAVDDAVITWGFKESFRSYISGSIANGEWAVADGATYETPEFGWADGQGAYDPSASEGLIAFGGSIRFTGHGGVLDTTVANPQLRFIDDETAVLLMDVSGTTQDGTPVDQKAVEFVELDLTGGVVTIAEGEVTVDAAPTVLLPAGADAFGTYEAGEAFDPLTATFTLPEDCLQPHLDTDIPGADQAEGDPAASAGPDLGWLVWVILGALVLGAVVALLVVRSRRRA